MTIDQETQSMDSYIVLELKINFEFKKGVGIAIKSKETNS